MSGPRCLHPVPGAGTRVWAVSSSLGCFAERPVQDARVTEPVPQGVFQPGQDFTVRIVPYVRPELAGPLPANLVTDILRLDRVELLTYQ